MPFDSKTTSYRANQDSITSRKEPRFCTLNNNNNNNNNYNYYYYFLFPFFIVSIAKLEVKVSHASSSVNMFVLKGATHGLLYSKGASILGFV
jgi:hypothetical protein